MQITTSQFDYGSLDAETRVAVQQKTGEIKERLQFTSKSLLEIGQRLIEVKETLPHGEFTRWLESEFQWTDRTAQQMMKIAAFFKTEGTSVLAMSRDALCLLASPSTPATIREAVLVEVRAGKTAKLVLRKKLAAHRRNLFK